ncbi:MAG: hypothetical protein AAGC67_19235 [Myxococcota bacterium]
MNRVRLYRILMGSLGIAFFLFGMALIASFFLYQRPHSTPLITTGPIGHYFVAFCGCALVGWAGGLVGAARNPWSSRSVGTMTIVALVLMSVIRMVAWIIGDYAEFAGDTLRTEVTVFLSIALALIWTKPTVAESRTGGPAMAPAGRGEEA